MQSSRTALLKMCVRKRFSLSAGEVKEVGKEGGEMDEERREARKETVPSTPTMRQET